MQFSNKMTKALPSLARLNSQLLDFVSIFLNFGCFELNINLLSYKSGLSTFVRNKLSVTSKVDTHNSKCDVYLNYLKRGINKILGKLFCLECQTFIKHFSASNFFVATPSLLSKR